MATCSNVCFGCCYQNHIYIYIPPFFVVNVVMFKTPAIQLPGFGKVSPPASPLGSHSITLRSAALAPTWDDGFSQEDDALLGLGTHVFG